MTGRCGLWALLLVGMASGIIVGWCAGVLTFACTNGFCR